MNTLAAQPDRKSVERIDSNPVPALVGAESVWRFVGRRYPARPECQPELAARRQGADDALWGPRLRPPLLPVERHRVGINAPRGKAVHDDDPIVVAGDTESAGAMAQHLDLAVGVGLDPDRRVRLPDIAQHRTDDEGGHDRTSTRDPSSSGVGRGPRPQACAGRRTSLALA